MKSPKEWEWELHQRAFESEDDQSGLVYDRAQARGVIKRIQAEARKRALEEAAMHVQTRSLWLPPKQLADRIRRLADSPEIAD